MKIQRKISKIMERVVKLSCFCILLCYGYVVHAQTISFNEAIQELSLVQQTFQTKTGTYVSCNISYLYSKEFNSGKYLDSLSGLYKASGSSRYSKVGNTETVQNDSVMVVIYNDQKTVMAAPTNQPTGNDRQLFLNTIDSTFVALNADSILLSKKAGIKTMTFKFGSQSAYYNCVLIYDAKSYIPQSLSYILKDSKLAESGKPPAEGGIITILFRNYSQAPFDTSILSQGNYVSVKAGVKGSLQPGYSGYTYFQNGDVGAKKQTK